MAVIAHHTILSAVAEELLFQKHLHACGAHLSTYRQTAQLWLWTITINGNGAAFPEATTEIKEDVWDPPLCKVNLQQNPWASTKLAPKKVCNIFLREDKNMPATAVGASYPLGGYGEPPLPHGSCSYFPFQVSAHELPRVSSSPERSLPPSPLSHVTKRNYMLWQHSQNTRNELLCLILKAMK